MYLSPFASIDPTTSCLNAQSVSFAILPLAAVSVAYKIERLQKRKSFQTNPNTSHQYTNKRTGGPNVDAGHLEAVVPRASVFTLALGTGAHAMTVRFAVLLL